MKIDPQAIEDAAQGALHPRAEDAAARHQERLRPLAAIGDRQHRAADARAPWSPTSRVAEQTDNLLCQDTGVPIYNVVDRPRRRGRRARAEGRRCGAAASAPRASIRCARSVVHPLTRKNEHTSCGIEVPVIHVDFSDRPDAARDRDDPQGQRLGEQLVPEDGDSGRRHRRDQDLRHRLRARRRRQDLPADDRRRRHRRHVRPVRRAGQARGDARRSAAAAPIPRAPRSRRSSRRR